MKTRPTRTTPPLPPSQQWQNFCEAMAEQELFESGAFPDAKDVTDVHNELERLANEIATDENRPQPPDSMNVAGGDAGQGDASERLPGKGTPEDQHIAGAGVPKFHLLGLSVVPGGPLFDAPKRLPGGGTSHEKQTPEKEPVKNTHSKKD